MHVQHESELISYESHEGDYHYTSQMLRVIINNRTEERSACVCDVQTQSQVKRFSSLLLSSEERIPSFVDLQIEFSFFRSKTILFYIQIKEYQKNIWDYLKALVPARSPI